MTNDEFEELAEQFYNETGYLAPGKDWPAMLCGDPRGDYDVRLAKWKEWNQRRAAGPLAPLEVIAANHSSDPVLANIEQGVRDGLAKAGKDSDANLT
jgi:hypothetical protein